MADSTVTSYAPPPRNGDATTSPSYGSSVWGAIFNFCNCVFGAGAIGLGGAFAASGGVLSVVTMLFFAVVTKFSLDMVVEMSLDASVTASTTSNAPVKVASYEDLGLIAFGKAGKYLVLWSKFAYAFGCLVAYTIVVKDNFASAMQHIVYGGGHDESGFFYHFLSDDSAQENTTWVLGLFVLLPLSLLRDITPLEKISIVSVLAFIGIVGIVISLYFTNPEIRVPGGTFQDHWLEVKPGYIQSLGTFIFTFVAHHTVNLVFESLKPELRTVGNWRRVSTWTMIITSMFSLALGVGVYMTFWDSSTSDMFGLYPPMFLIDFIKLLLCMTMLFTYPPSLISCRELLIDFAVDMSAKKDNSTDTTISSPNLSDMESSRELEQPLLTEDSNGTTEVVEEFTLPTTTTCSAASGSWIESMLLRGYERQLIFPFHFSLTIVMVYFTTLLAIKAPSLGDVLNIVGCASGTMMAFILPAILSYKLQGRTAMPAFILCIGGPVGFIGTYYSLIQLIEDLGV